MTARDATRSPSRVRSRKALTRFRPSGCGNWRRRSRREFLDGLEIDRAPAFAAWLAAQRRRFRSCHVAVLEQLVRDASDDEAFSSSLRNGSSWLRLTAGSTSSFWLPSCGAAKSVKARNILQPAPACSKPKASIPPRCTMPGWPPKHDETPRRAYRLQLRSRPRQKPRAPRRDRRAPARLHRGDAVRRPIATYRHAGRRRGRAGRRCDHPPGKTAQPVRHRARDRVRTARPQHGARMRRAAR